MIQHDPDPDLLTVLFIIIIIIMFIIMSKTSNLSLASLIIKFNYQSQISDTIQRMDQFHTV